MTEESPIPEKQRVNRTNRWIRAFLWLAFFFIAGVGLLNLLPSDFLAPDFTSNTRMAEAHMNTINVALTQYKTLNRTLPTTEEGLAALVQPPANARSQKKLAVAAAIRDPWGRAYQYRNPAVKSEGPFDLWSFGADGKDGTEDDVILRYD